MAKSKKSAKNAIDTRVVIHDGYDDLAFETVRDYARVNEILQDSPKGDPEKVVEGLMKDVFTSFYRTNAQIDEEKQKTLTRDIIEEFHGMREFQDFHKTSSLDAVASALGAIEMGPVLIEKLNEVREKIEQQREQQRQQNEQQGKDPNDGVPSGEPSLDELDGEGQAVLRQGIRKAIEQAEKENEEQKGMMRQWGIEPGELQQMNAHERLALADRMKQTSKLKDVSKLIGRFKNVVNSALATVPSHGSDEIVDITLGGDISRMLPTEAMKLLTQPLLFYKDLSENNLLQYNMKGTDNMGKGPMITCFDISGSMQGGREAWAKAVVLTLMAYAQKERRSCGWIAFESRVHDSAFYPKASPPSIQEKFRVAEMSTTGGTNFEKPLRECMEMHGQEPELKPADIVFITDGECVVSEEFLKEFSAWRKEKNVRVFGIGIADKGSYVYEKAGFESLDSFCDHVCMVNDLGEVTALRQVVQAAHKNLEDHQ